MRWIRFINGARLFFRSSKGPRITGATPPPVQPDERVYTNVLHPGALFHHRSFGSLPPAWKIAIDGRDREAEEKTIAEELAGKGQEAEARWTPPGGEYRVPCACGCGQTIVSEPKYAGASCRVRAERLRDA